MGVGIPGGVGVSVPRSGTVGVNVGAIGDVGVVVAKRGGVVLGVSVGAPGGVGVNAPGGVAVSVGCGPEIVSLSLHPELASANDASAPAILRDLRIIGTSAGS